MPKIRVRKPKHTLEQIAKYFSERGCTLLSKSYAGSKQILQYKCKCGGIRVTTYNNFYRGSGCCRMCLIKTNAPAKKRRLQALVLREARLSMTEVSDLLGIYYDDFRTAVKITKTLPAPTHAIPGKAKLYYSQEDVDQIMEMIYLE